MKVLITGMSGLIGGAVRRLLEGRFELSALNRRPVEGVPCHRADIADLDAIRPAFEGVDAVVHLAAAIRGDWETLLRNNVVGTYNVLEASRQAGVSRVVYASSGSVVSGWEQEEPYQSLVSGEPRRRPPPPGPCSPTRPLSGRRVSTAAPRPGARPLARHYSDSTGLSVICLRIGAVRPEDRALERRDQSVYCSQANVAVPRRALRHGAGGGPLRRVLRGLRQPAQLPRHRTRPPGAGARAARVGRLLPRKARPYRSHKGRRRDDRQDRDSVLQFLRLRTPGRRV